MTINSAKFYNTEQDALIEAFDRMLRLAVRNKNLLQVRVENPLQWLMEITNAGRN